MAQQKTCCRRRRILLPKASQGLLKDRVTARHHQQGQVCTRPQAAKVPAFDKGGYALSMWMTACRHLLLCLHSPHLSDMVGTPCEDSCLQPHLL